MARSIPSNVRVLELLFELLGADLPRTKQELRRLPGYEGLSESAFEAQFHRDKQTLRDSGITVVTCVNHENDEAYAISSDELSAAKVELDPDDVALIRMAADAWSSGDQTSPVLDVKIAGAAHNSVFSLPQVFGIDLTGSHLVADLSRAIRQRCVISFHYSSTSSGLVERSIEPWRIIVRGQAMYVVGWDLDRRAPRVFRLTRFRSDITVLGEPGDASAAPQDLVDPFASLMVRPILAIRPGDEDEWAPFLESDPCVGERPGEVCPDIPLPSGWPLVQGRELPTGEWVSRILRHGRRAIVVAPAQLRADVLGRVTAASVWEEHHA
ncbi:WYL domain-containing protein [Schaalia sp. ZJ1691]|uniref:helix-turn-helix transcriptional regulator n=1 Tax=Schaalia sp. ZJ1691 TaxID=2709404 RepID=UPI0013EC0E0E|nr:WYL domain-containing protein [Schaalia sp. ZJ1691]